ncbi:MAG: hypothetical protein ACFFDH_13810, partial [Promethearchaeota archaeon]
MNKKTKRKLIIAIVLCGIIGGAAFFLVSLSPATEILVEGVPAPVLDPITPNPNVDGTIELYWTAAEDYSDTEGVTFDRYIIYRKINDETVWSPYKESQINHYTVSGYPSGTYKFAVMTFLKLEIAPGLVSEKPSDLSNSRTVVVDRGGEEPPTEKPEAPTLYPIQSPNTDGEIVLQWDTVSGATGYSIYRSDNGGPNLCIKGGLTSTSYIDTITLSGTYTYRVYAYNFAEISPASETVSVQVDFPVLPPAPTPPEREPLPSNPSILLDATTEIFEITVQLSCDSAVDMR